MIGVAVYKRISASLCAGMKWGWKPAQRWAAPPVTGPPFSRWKLPLLDNQRHCWTFTQTHRVACRPASYSPGHLHASRTGGFFIMRCTAGWNIPARASLAVAAPHWCARISPPCVKTKRCSHTQSTSTRYATLCVLPFFKKRQICLKIYNFLMLLNIHWRIIYPEFKKKKPFIHLAFFAIPYKWYSVL